MTRVVLESRYATTSTNGRDNRSSCRIRDSCNTRQRLDECVGHIGTGQIRGRQNERANVGFDQGLPFDRAAPNVSILAENNPAVGTDFLQPFCVGCPGSEVIAMDVNGDSHDAECRRDDVSTEPFVEEDGIVRQPLGG